MSDGMRAVARTRWPGKAHLGPADQIEQGQLQSGTLEPPDSGHLSHLFSSHELAGPSCIASTVCQALGRALSIEYFI